MAIIRYTVTLRRSISGLDEDISARDVEREIDEDLRCHGIELSDIDEVNWDFYSND